MVKCGKCSDEIVSLKECIKCVDCKESYHVVSCTRIKSLENFKKLGAKKLLWKCNSCKSETSSTSSRSEPETQDINPILAAITNLREEIHVKMDTRFDKLGEDIVGVRDDLSGLKQEIAGLKKSNEAIIKELDAVKEENGSLKSEVLDLRCHIQDLQQYTRQNNVIISGIPVTENEDMLGILGNIAEVLGLAFVQSEVSAAHRLPARRGDSKPASIVVQFVSRATKVAWIAAKKRKRDFSTTELRGSLRKHDIFINEHLTPTTMAIFGRARQLARTGQVLYAWVRDCKVFVRRRQNGPAVRILQLDELEPPRDHAPHPQRN